MAIRSTTTTTRRPTARQAALQRVPKGERRCEPRPESFTFPEIKRFNANQEAARQEIIREIFRLDERKRRPGDTPGRACTGDCERIEGGPPRSCATVINEDIDARIECRRAYRGNQLIWVCTFAEGKVKTRCECL